MRHIFFSIHIEHNRSFECITKNQGVNTFILLNALHTVLNVHIARVCACVWRVCMAVLNVFVLVKLYIITLKNSPTYLHYI